MEKKTEIETLVKSLNDRHGNNWSNTFQPWGERIIIHLTVQGITRSAVAESEDEAFKKAYGYFTK